CYGMQLGSEVLGGKVRPSAAKEFGQTTIDLVRDDPLFRGIRGKTTVWMSHGDQVKDLDGSFVTLASTATCLHAAVRHLPTGFLGVQFHPEVTHTPEGKAILKNFLYDICGCHGDWSLSKFVEEETRELRRTVGKGRVVCALSGGIDSSVVALLLHRAVG